MDNNNVFANPSATAPTATLESENAVSAMPAVPTGEVDPKSIIVTVNDSKAPIVVFFGAPKCGKTMILIRLARYLSREGYVVKPLRDFRPADDIKYTLSCDEFNAKIANTFAAKGTERIDFMLVEVVKNGKRICQLLEAPGEHYFNPENPSDQWPPYVQNIINSHNRKVWSIIIDPSSCGTTSLTTVSLHNQYVAKIQELDRQKSKRDKAIVIFNKIDTTNLVKSPGQIYTKEAIGEMVNLYPGLINIFKNRHPITSLWRRYNLSFVPFQTGSYTTLGDGKQVFTEGTDDYPRQLWNELKRCFNG